MNPLRTRADVERFAHDLLTPLVPRAIHGGAGFHLGDTAAHYSSRTAAFEGWSRMLWAVAPLLAGGGSFGGLKQHLEGLRHGTNPAGPWYWGETTNMDQRSVEMAAVAVALLLAPDQFWHPLSDGEKNRLWTWLDGINRSELAANNWQFFRVLVNVAFLELGLPHNQKAMDESLTFVDGLYRDEGWYADGVNFDYYVPFALHYYGLIYARFMGQRDPKRCQLYRERARAFAGQLLPWFHEDGSAVPYGRSLTYRFAMVSYFSACAFADEEVLPWGAMKGLLLRNLRWWRDRPMLDHEGILTIGYGYPNLLMAEQYNSPTSPYWAFKALLALALPGNHPFWSAAEAPLPAVPAIVHQPVPHYVLQKTGHDTVLLCPGAYPPYEVVQNAAKYSKFAYSARFAFSVAHPGAGLEKQGGDSMLLLSEGDGYWRERRQVEDIVSGPQWVSSLWRPWKTVSVRTWQVAVDAWHVRVHRVESDRELEAAEGGFAAPFVTEFELEPPRSVDEPRRTSVEDGLGAARFDGFGASSRVVGLKGDRRGEVVATSPNLNLIFSQVRIPTLRGTLKPGVTWLACAVTAGDPAFVAQAAPPRLEAIVRLVPGLLLD